MFYLRINICVFSAFILACALFPFLIASEHSIAEPIPSLHEDNIETGNYQVQPEFSTGSESGISIPENDETEDVSGNEPTAGETEPDKENDLESPELASLKERRLRILPVAEPGLISYIDRESLDAPITGMSMMTIDRDGSPGIIFLTAASMEVFQFSEGLKAERIWKGRFVDEFPYRGLASTVFSGALKDQKYIFVSINKFNKSFAYRWENDILEKAGRANGFFVDVLPSQSVNLMSEYGDGVISFSGPATHFVDTSGDEPEKHSFPIMEDYYSGCILKWLDVSVELARIAIVTEHGIVKVYQGPGAMVARSGSVYGGRIACIPTMEKEYLFVSTESEADDAIAVLEVNGEEINEVWRTPSLGGTVRNFTVCELDGDGEKELLGVLVTEGGREMLFRLLPEYKEVTVDEIEESD